MRYLLALAVAGELLARGVRAQQPVLPSVPVATAPATMPAPPELPLVVGRVYRVVPRTGSPFVGQLVATVESTLTFEIKGQGAVTVERVEIGELTDRFARSQERDYVGNGTHMYQLPTARNLHRGEGEVQATYLYLVSANYGLTDNFSLGLTVPLLPGTDFYGALTPKLSVPVAEKLRLGVGALVGLGRGSEHQLQSTGLGYGLATYGTANANLTLGLGYSLFRSENASRALLVVGGNVRVGRRLFLTDETYFVRGYMASIVGVRVAGPHLSVGAGALVAPIVYDIYFPLPYFDVAYRFGKTK